MLPLPEGFTELQSQESDTGKSREKWHTWRRGREAANKKTPWRRIKSLLRYSAWREVGDFKGDVLGKVSNYSSGLEINWSRLF